jgi:murein L,D-transpeptidase YcbB/YkuD
MRAAMAAVALVAAFWLPTNGQEFVPMDADTAATLVHVLDGGQHPSLTWSDIRDVVPALRALYANEADGLFWFEAGRPVPALPGALETLRQCADRGLDPVDYDGEKLGAAAQAEGAAAPSAPDRALLDLAVSVGVLRTMAAVRHGRIDPRSLAFDYDIAPRRLDGAAVLRQARDGTGIPASVDALEPPFPHYARAKAVLRLYRGLAAQGDAAVVPPLAKNQTRVEHGTNWAGVPALRARLVQLGDLVEAAPNAGEVYSDALVEAVKRFQARHVLDADGVIGKSTIEALNVPVADRARQIEIALERMRWLPEMANQPLVFVNVALYRLWASDPRRSQEPLRMRVVVGKALDHRTPLFVESMRYVVFRPYWNPPYSIAVKELVPHQRGDPGYFDKEDLEIVARGDDNAPALPPTRENLAKVVAGTLYIRQRPGPRNSLGLAKFIFPNTESVYMHGSPAQSLFGRTRRDFSHGCIRLQDPKGLAEWVLKDQPEWTRERIEAAMQGERPQQVNLKEPLTVVLFYDTVHVNSENVVFFAADIYGHDHALDLALKRGYPYPEQRANESLTAGSPSRAVAAGPRY